MYHIDPYWWFVIPGLIIGIIAQIKLSAAYNHYIQVPAESGLSGAQAAREILDRAGLTSMAIEEVGGHLTDHYDPTKKALFLSSDNYHGRTLAAIGVAAHEAGHALQHKAAYAPLKLRMWMVPATQFASTAWVIIALLGMFMGFFPLLIHLAIGVFSVISFFQLVTLPVEFDASRRAKEQLFSMGLISRNEQTGVAKVLNAAALTYVAALVSSVLMLLRFLMMARNRD